jgi:hypothetical protein
MLIRRGLLGLQARGLQRPRLRWVWRRCGSFKLPNRLAKRASDPRKFVAAEEEQRDYQDYNQFLKAKPKHRRSSSIARKSYLF